MNQADSEPSVEMSLTECESEMISALREIRDAEAARMIIELVHVLSISHVAEVIPLSQRATADLKIAGGADVAKSAFRKDSVPIDLDLVDA